MINTDTSGARTLHLIAVLIGSVLISTHHNPKTMAVACHKHLLQVVTLFPNLQPNLDDW